MPSVHIKWKCTCIQNISCLRVYIKQIFAVGIMIAWIVHMKYNVLNGNNMGIPSKKILNARQLQNISIYITRRQIASDACMNNEWKYYGSYSNIAFRQHMLVNRRYDTILCGVEKVGYTFWRRMFMVMNDSSTQRSPYDIHPSRTYDNEKVDVAMSLSAFTQEEESAILGKSLKFLFVRDPYDRLFSAYIDKFFFPNIVYWKTFGPTIIRNSRENPDSTSLHCGHDITFSDFVKAFIKSQMTLISRDNHFIPMYEHCRPCTMKYDIIGKMETFKPDMMHILKKLGAEKLSAKLENSRSDALKDAFIAAANGYFYAVYAQLMKNCIKKFDALKRLWKSMQIRGLIGSEKVYPFTETESNNLTQEALLQALTDASNLNETERHMLSSFRKRTIIDAFSTLTNADLHKLSEIFQPDCDIFGYDCRPTEIFRQRKHT